MRGRHKAPVFGGEGLERFGREDSRIKRAPELPREVGRWKRFSGDDARAGSLKQAEDAASAPTLRGCVDLRLEVAAILLKVGCPRFVAGKADVIRHDPEGVSKVQESERSVVAVERRTKGEVDYTAKVGQGAFGCNAPVDAEANKRGIVDDERRGAGHRDLVSHGDVDEVLVVQGRLQAERQKMVVAAAATSGEVRNPTLKGVRAKRLGKIFILPELDLDGLELFAGDAVGQLIEGLKGNVAEIHVIVHVDSAPDGAAVERIIGMPISSWTVARETCAASVLNLLPSRQMRYGATRPEGS